MANAKGMGKRSATKPVKTDMNGHVDDRKYLCPYCNKEKKTAKVEEEQPLI